MVECGFAVGGFQRLICQPPVRLKAQRRSGGLELAARIRTSAQWR